MVTVTITADRYTIVVDHEGHRYTQTMESTGYGAKGASPYDDNFASPRLQVTVSYGAKGVDPYNDSEDTLELSDDLVDRLTSLSGAAYDIMAALREEG